MSTHREFHFVKPPEGLPTSACFELIETATPQPGEGEVLVATRYLSIDPYFRNAMAGIGYGLQPGRTMIGRGCGVVVKSRHDRFVEGDAVQGEFGWRERVILKGNGLRKLPADLEPMSLSLGAVGQSAATAWVGLYDVAGMTGGETVVVSAAAGAVGSAAGQIAMLAGCRAVGIAGGPEKCRYVIDELGFADCIDYKAGDLDAAFRAAVPEGFDIYFDNVGGDILDTALLFARERARIPVCGQISQYNAEHARPLRNVGQILGQSLIIQGFKIGARLEARDAALVEVERLWRGGRLKWHETVSDGFETAPAALINMLTGGNVGKQVVRVGE